MVGTIAILQWGRSGAGPLVAFHMASALHDAGANVVVSHASGAEIADRFAALPVPQFAVTTFESKFGALMKAPILLAHAIRLRSFLKRNGVSSVVIAMEQLWLSLAIPLIRSRNWTILLSIHDAEMHPGDDNVVERTTRSVGRRFSQGAIVFSTDVRDRLVQSGQYTSNRVWQSVLGAFPTETQRVGQKTFPRERPPVIGFFGRLSKYKGLQIGHAAVEALRSEGTPLVFRVVGEGDRSLVEGMGHPDDELRLGWVPENSVTSVLDGFDVLLLPYAEASQSGVLSFAMSLGLPAIVTPVGGLIEQAQSAGCALIARDATPDAVSDELRVLLGDAELYESLARAGLRAARERFSWDRVAIDVLAAASATEPTRERSPGT